MKQNQKDVKEETTTTKKEMNGQYTHSHTRTHIHTHMHTSIFEV